jgi:peroxiredoxin
MAVTAIGGYAPDFELPGADGTVHHLARYLESHQLVCVVVMCNHCPYVKLYLDRLKALHQDYTAQNVALIAINPNDAAQFPEDSFANMKPFILEQGILFPYLRDETQDVAHTLGATKTPHAFLLNKQGVLVYSGAIDDNAQDRNAVKTHYLRDAIDRTLNGEPILDPSTDPIGCSVKWRHSYSI